MRIFHLTYWYPSRGSEAIWIKRHIDALSRHVDAQSVFHFELKVDRKFRLKLDRLGEDRHSWVFSGPLPWWLLELIALVGLSYILFVKSRKYDLINVHIGYPLLTYYHLIKGLIRRPIVLTEHWSAYHFNFGVDKPLFRARKIFTNGLPLITVSESLKSDIEKFSGMGVARGSVIPNVVDSVFRRYDLSEQNPCLFFMVSHWKWPKRPDIVLRAFAELLKEDKNENYQLRIGGHGPQIGELEALVDELKLHNSIKFLGNLSPEVVAKEMNKCAAFLHCSEYETFSVVCAEAACCGTPVIASAVGGIPEFIDGTNGILVRKNTKEEWLFALKARCEFDRDKNSKMALSRFSAENVGRRYFNFIKEIEVC